MFAEARRTRTGKWNVFCADCKKSIGTMTGETFSRAITFALTRGGVKCPKCRKNSCPSCSLLTVHGERCTLCILTIMKGVKVNPRLHSAL